MKDKHPGGRPMAFKTPKNLKDAVNLYFEENIKPTLSGLAVALKIDRRSLYNYEAKDEFFPIIKEAREKVEAVYEERLVYSTQPTGVIFALKNMGWKDKTETELTGKDGGPLQITGMTIT